MTALKLRLPSETPLTAADHDENMLRLYGFADLAALFADEDRDYDFYAAGATVFTLAEGFRYQVAASGATDHHLTTAAGLKLYVLPGDDGAWNLLAFGAAGDDEADDLLPWRRALKAAAGGILRVPRRTYFCSKVVEVWQPIYIDADQGATLRVPGGTDGIIIHHLWSAGRSSIALKNMTSAAMLAHHAGLVKYGGEVYRANYGVSAANLKAETPGTGSRWVHMRSVEGRDSVVATWTAEGPNGSGNFQVINPQQLDPTNHLPLPGMYVLCQQDGFYYRVAAPDADDHDELTMFDVKLYIVDPADYPSYTTAAGTIVDNLEVGGTDPTVMTTEGAPAHGIWLRTAAHLRNVKARNFSGNGIQTVAAVLGEAPNPDGIDSMEAFNAQAKAAALDVMGGSLGTGFSNADRDFVLDQVPGLQNTEPGNRMLIDIQCKLQARRIEIARRARAYERTHGQLDAGFNHELAQWAEAKASQRFGIPVEELSRLKYAADLSDVSLEALGTSAQRLSRNMVEAARGNKTATQAFSSLGIEVRAVPFFSESNGFP